MLDVRLGCSRCDHGVVAGSVWLGITFGMRTAAKLSSSGSSSRQTAQRLRTDFHRLSGSIDVVGLQRANSRNFENASLLTIKHIFNSPVRLFNSQYVVSASEFDRARPSSPAATRDWLFRPTSHMLGASSSAHRKRRLPWRHQFADG